MKTWHITYSTNKDWNKNVSTDSYNSYPRYIDAVDTYLRHFRDRAVFFVHAYSMEFTPGAEGADVELLISTAHSLPEILELNTELVA